MKKSSLVLFSLLSLLCLISLSTKALVYPFTTNNQLELLPDPYASKDLKLELVRKAKHHIHIMTYFWDKSTFPTELANELNLAHERGVEVRIISTFFPSFVTDIFQKAKKNLKLKSKNPNTVFSYLPLKLYEGLTFTNNIHEKLFLIDSEVAIIGGRNIADSALRGKDMEVLIKGELVNQAQDHFKIMFDFISHLKSKSECETTSKKSAKIEKSKQCVQSIEKTKFSIQDKNYFKNYDQLEIGFTKARLLTHEAIIKQYENKYNPLERAKMPDDILDTIVNTTEFKTVRTYNYFILPTERYMDFLVKSKKENKDVRIITNGLEAATFSSNKGYLFGISYMEKLIKENVDIYQWKKNPHGNNKETYIHAKVLTFDDDHGFIGSHNLGFGSTMSSNEMAVEFFDTEIVKELNNVFDHETSTETITKKATPKLLSGEALEYEWNIKILKSESIENFLKELY